MLGKDKSDSGEVHQTHLEVDTYNAAFDDLGLDWRLDHADYEDLARSKAKKIAFVRTSRRITPIC